MDSSKPIWVELSREEYLLMRSLVRNVSQTVPYEVIDRVIWGREMRGDEGPRRKLLHRLRIALEGLGLTVRTDHSNGLRLEQIVP